MTIVVGHRGDPKGHVENTIEAFDSAVALGASMVELDCRLTRDGVVVVLHDETLDRLWHVPGPVGALTWDEVQLVGRDRYRIPTLSAVLSHVRVPVMVDVSSVVTMEGAVAVVEAAKATSRCIFAGGTGALGRLRQLCPGARIALTWDKFRAPAPGLLSTIRPEWFNPSWARVTPGLVGRMHADGIGVSVWTVDNPVLMRLAVSAGVDALITNEVARAVAAVRSGSTVRPGFGEADPGEQRAD